MTNPDDTSRLMFPCGMSRSGTTLLATILDSHPDVSMGYELLPAGLPSTHDMIRKLEGLISDLGDDADACGGALRRDGHQSFGTFVKRCGRTTVQPSELLDVLKRFDAEKVTGFESLAMRARLSAAVVRVKQQRERAAALGFKINSPGVSTIADLYPQASFIYIVRDPRDVVASHIKKGFDRTIDHICAAWNNYLEKFQQLIDAEHPQAIIVRYEDLVSHPDVEIARIADCCRLPPDPAMRSFFRSKASVHAGGHANATELQQDFFTGSVGRWKSELMPQQIRAIEERCSQRMDRYGYHLFMTGLVKLDRASKASKQENFTKRALFHRDQYGQLLGPHLVNTNLTWAEAAGGLVARDDDIVIIRHDVDHDYETALRMAKWEADKGLRATYCILHTAWYYAAGEDGTSRTQDVIDCCLELQSLGHEINLHNNAVVVALQTGADPRDVLERELTFLRLHGIDIAGTSSHGDALCRDLNFFNCELFKESVYESKGGRRWVEAGDHRVELGVVSMADFGLTYEAYDIPRDYYITDSGGRMRVRHDTRGRGGLRRAESGVIVPYGRITGILTHPIWWDMTRDALPDASLPELDPPVWLSPTTG